MRTLRNDKEALLEAITMLRVVERGGSYATFDWYERLNKIQSFLPPEHNDDLHSFIIFDLQASKTRTKGNIG